MLHHPTSIDSPLPAASVALAERARAGALAIYAGAGLSFAPPTELPNGPALARRVHTRLLGAFPGLATIPSDDLVAISDLVVTLDGGEDALRQAIANVAEFTSADPSYGHQALALLLLEGVVDVLTTNWDDCIERGYSHERVQAVVNQHDLTNIVGPSVLKIHGCATQPSTLLLTSDHLQNPPTWAIEQTRSRLGTSVVVFVGIGDVADYVQLRLAEAVSDVGAIDNIRVVSPSIIEKWDTSQWAGVAPGLSPEHKVAATADAFLEALASAYIYLALAEMKIAAVGSSAEQGMLSAIEAISRHDAVRVLSWLRSSGVVSRRGVSVLQGASTATMVLALGTLAGDQIMISPDNLLQTADGLIESIVAVGIQSGTRLRREAQNRLERRIAAGLEPPRYLISGGLGWSDDLVSLPGDIVRAGRTDDILDGPANHRPVILRAEEVAA